MKMSERELENEEIHMPPSTLSANVNISELDEETNQKLKGDAIGDTLYSQSFVLKSLLKFSDFEWNEQFEEDLCFLWDMTMEKDVCAYLFDVSYPTLACAALQQTCEPRFTEIVIGILANILCVDCPNKKVNDGELNTILKELYSDDPPILIQVMRLISAIAHVSCGVSCINENQMTKIKFIMNNSVNHELLEKSLEAVVKLTTDHKLNNKFVNLELYEVTLTAYTTIFNNSHEYSLDSKDKFTTCKYTLEIICNICSYIDRYENYELLLELQRHSNRYVNEVLKILHFYSLEENLLPVTDEVIFFISVFRYTLTTLHINFIPTLFKDLCQILLIIKDIQDEVTDMFEAIIELMCFLVSQDVNKKFVNILKTFSKNRIKSVLKFLNENQHKYAYKLDLQDLLCEYSK